MTMPKYTSADTYDEILDQLKALLDPAFSTIANMANIASILYWAIEDLNWIGFYTVEDDKLMLGPFHGKPACVTIELGKGVCGTAAELQQTLIVPNVDEFPGHIMCDIASRSEIVVPILQNGSLLGVLDADSPSLNRFQREERELFEATVRLLLATAPDG
jgi:L-methionine (R)-S-oxide reductase